MGKKEESLERGMGLGGGYHLCQLQPPQPPPPAPAAPAVHGAFREELSRLQSTKGSVEVIVCDCRSADRTHVSS